MKMSTVLLALIVQLLVPTAALRTIDLQSKTGTDIQCSQLACQTVDSQFSDGKKTLCSDYLFNLLGFLQDELTARNLPFSLGFGTLLGAVRDQNVIPWTIDVDLVLPDATFRELSGQTLAIKPGSDFFDLIKKMAPSADVAEAHLVIGEKQAKSRNGEQGQLTFLRGCVGGVKNYDGAVIVPESPFDEHRANTLPYTDMYNLDLWPPLNAVRDAYEKGMNSGKSFVKVRHREFVAPEDGAAVVEHFYGESWQQEDEERNAHGAKWREHKWQKKFTEA